MSSKKTVFNDQWLKEPQFSSWLGKSKDSTKASCHLCGVFFELGNMGRKALNSHAKGKKHILKMEMKTGITNQKIDLFCRSQPAKEGCSSQHVIKPSNLAEPLDTQSMTVPPPPPPPPTPSTVTTQPLPCASTATHSNSISKYVTKDATLSAEVLWAIKVLMSHYSCNSSAGTGMLFSKMFPDSQIAEQFQCGATKCSYLICFGIAPYFHDQLMQKLSRPDTKYVISFDESLNKVIQKEQMDLIIRFWDQSVNKVVSRYFDSQFLGHTRAVDLCKNIKLALSKLKQSNLIQVSMDGPNVNWKFFDDFIQDRELSDPDASQIINIGACSLHVVHGGFKYGATATGWNLDSLLRSLWYIFSDSPAKREDYQSITGSNVWPLRFCGTRWLEDIPVAERAILIWPSIKQYVKKVIEGPKSKVPTSQSFRNLKEYTLDPLVPAKLQFFIAVAKILQPFLKKFQTDKPMVPFLSEELQCILKAILGKFVKQSVLDEATTAVKLVKIDVMKKDSIVAPKKVDTGFAAKMLVQDIQTKKEASPLQILEFYNGCIAFYQQLSRKLMERCPLQYAIVRHSVSLNPKYIVAKPDTSSERFSNLLKALISKKLITHAMADIALQQYKNLLLEVRKELQEVFSVYCPSDEGLDEFFLKHIGERSNFAELWSVVKVILILSHGQSSVERGFSENKDILSVNMKQETLIAYRRAYNGIKNQGCAPEESISKELLTSCSHAYRKYQMSLSEKKKEQESDAKEKIKQNIRNELAQTRKKKLQLQTTAESLIKEADDLAETAELKNNLTLLVKSNALRQKSRQKRKEADKEEGHIEQLEKRLKSV